MKKLDPVQRRKVLGPFFENVTEQVRTGRKSPGPTVRNRQPRPLFPADHVGLITESWTGSALQAASAVAHFRRMVQQWNTVGAIDNNEFQAAIQHLTDVGLGSFVTEIMATGIMALEID